MVKKRPTLLRTLMRAGQQQQRATARLLGALMPPAPPSPPVKKITRKPAGSWLTLNYVTLGAHLRYFLYWPASAIPGQPVPLAVMLHGCEQTATSFADGSRLNRMAEKLGYAVLYPQQSSTSHPQRCWKWYDRATQHGGGDAALIVAVVNSVIAAYPVDRRRLYIGGISAGAAMAHIVALNQPGMFAALGMHSGPAFGAGHSGVGALGVMRHGAGSRADEAIAEVLLRAQGKVHLPTIVIHGEDDQVVRPVNQMQLAGQALRLNRLHDDGVEKLADKPATRRTRAYRTRDVYRGRKLMLRMVRIAGLQHAWSGGDEQFRFNAAAGPDASRLMLEFFSRHSN